MFLIIEVIREGQTKHRRKETWESHVQRAESIFDAARSLASTITSYVMHVLCDLNFVPFSFKDLSILQIALIF